MIEFLWTPKSEHYNEVCKNFEIITAVNLLQISLLPSFFIKSSIGELFSSLEGNNLGLEDSYTVRMQQGGLGYSSLYKSMVCVAGESLSVCVPGILA